MPSNVICLVNFKGGVGKTSVAVNLSATLAHEPFNKRVLLIDLDAQANASIWTMGLEEMADASPEEFAEYGISDFSRQALWG